MRENVWIPLSQRERLLLIDALSSIRTAKVARCAKIDALASKLIEAKPHPQITVGVRGGLVQWALGNPFPIRICDYDIEGDEDPDVDERGQPCRIWFEPPDQKIFSSYDRGRSKPKDHSRSLKR
jgi:hypothetical protein